MPATLEESLLSIFRQSMLENLPAITLDGQPLRALEQNPDTKSRWAQQARAGKKVMQFLGDSGYLAVIVDAHLHLYANSKTKTSP